MKKTKEKPFYVPLKKWIKVPVVTSILLGPFGFSFNSAYAEDGKVVVENFDVEDEFDQANKKKDVSTPEEPMAVETAKSEGDDPKVQENSNEVEKSDAKAEGKTEEKTSQGQSSEPEKQNPSKRKESDAKSTDIKTKKQSDFADSSEKVITEKTVDIKIFDYDGLDQPFGWEDFVPPMHKGHLFGANLSREGLDQICKLKHFDVHVPNTEAVRKLSWWSKERMIDRFKEDGAPVLSASKHKKYISQITCKSLYTQLTHAIANNMKVRSMELVEQGYDVNEMDEKNGSTPLMYAAQKGDIPLIDMLLQYEANVSIVNPNNQKTALDYARESEAYFQVAERLIEKGADPRVVGKDGLNEWSRAINLGRFDYVEFLLENKYYDVNEQSKRSGLTPLMAACKQGNMEVVENLIYKEANLNQVNDAIVFKDKEKTEKKMSNKRPLDYCRKSERYIDLAKLLINSGADMNYVGTDGFTELTRAIRYDYGVYIDFLLKKGVDVNQVDTVNASTPLMYAAQKGDLELCNKLIEAGADRTIVGENHGLSAYEFFKKYNKENAANYEKLDQLLSNKDENEGKEIKKVKK